MPIEPVFIKHMLVTEDDPILKRFYEMALADVCENLEVVIDPELALEKLGHKQYDFLITDLKLGGKNGLDVISKAVVSNPDIKIMVASGYVNDAKYQDDLHSCPNIKGFLQKPFTVNILLQNLQSILLDQKDS